MPVQPGTVSPAVPQTPAYYSRFCYPVVTCPAVITGCSQKLGAVLSEAEETKVSDMWAASSKGAF